MRETLQAVLAFITWHRPAPGVDTVAYEHAVERFHRSLAHRPPSGFRSSAALRATELPWLAAGAGVPGAGYEDWYLVESWSALGVLEEAAAARGHLTSHDAVAAKSGVTSSGVYRLGEGHVSLGHARIGVWIAAAQGHVPPTMADLLGDGMDRETAGLWRRCLGLGPAPEYCLLAAEVPAGVAPERLPAGWRAGASAREVLWAS